MEETFSYWMRTNLKDAYSGLITQDIDFAFIFKENKGLFFLEEKNSIYARVGPAQKIIFKLFNDYLEVNSNFKGTYILYATDREESKNNLIGLIEKLKENRITKPHYEIENDILKKLWDCKGIPPKTKTERERSHYRGSIIKEILDGDIKNNFSFIEKIHWIFVNYCSGNFIFIEELINNSYINIIREEFLLAIDTIFREAKDSNAINPKSKAKYKYLGYYQLKFSRTNPDNSSEIYLNEKIISKEKLKKVLNLNDDSIRNFR